MLKIDFRPQESGEHVINCHPVGNSAKKPKSLLQLEAESLKLRHQKSNVSLLLLKFYVRNIG